MGFEINRFALPIDDFFLCKVCHMVVKKPVECTACEHLVCSDCSPSCPYCGCEQLTTPAKYVRLVYAKLHLSCFHKQHGCNFEGTVGEVDDHEPMCQYVYVPCASPICNREFLKKDWERSADEAFVCSRLCRSVLTFQSSLSTSTELELLLQLKAAILSSKADLMEQVHEELKPIQADLDRREQALKEAEQELIDLRTELEERRQLYHPGKWNSSTNLWTCCGEGAKVAIGCREL